MEKKRCPNCGKYVDADKTYCMSCGTTLGIRCPDCRAVLPVGTRSCPRCGHSFLRKTPRRPSAFETFVRSHPRRILLVTLMLCTGALLVLAACPALRVIQPDRADPSDILHASGYSLIGFLLGAHPADITELLALPLLRDTATGLRFALYGAGLGWLILSIFSLLSVWLALANRRTLGCTTTRRLFPLTGIALGGGLLIAGIEILIRILLGQAKDAALSAGSPIPFVAGVVSLVPPAAALWLYRLSLRTADGDRETAIPLGRVLCRPFVALARAVRRLFARKGSTGRTGTNRNRTVTCTRRLTAYLILLGAALIFTQALLSKVSNIFFWFLLILPGILFLYVQAARVSVTAVMHTGTVTVQKNTPCTYELCIRNHSILVFPFVEALVSVPQSNAVRCRECTLCLPLTALSDRPIRNTVSFRFRGTYDVGIREIYVYDLFRLFRVRIPVDAMTTVYVLPRRVSLEGASALAVSDSAARTVRSQLVVDRLEVSDIRDYRAGDPLKSIHWKLSSKSEQFVVKDYNTGTSDQTVVFCDLAPHFPETEPHPTPVGPATGQGSSRRSRRHPPTDATKPVSAGPPRAHRDGQTDDTHAISDEALDRRLKERAAAAEFRRTGTPDTMSDAAETSRIPVSDIPGDRPPDRDVQALASPSFYEDMNEYLADGVVELTIAVTLTELNRGHEVQLVWFDRRSESGLYVFRLRSIDEFDRIYHLFGTAPLCRADQSVPLLSSMVSGTGSDRQLFVLPAMDEETLSALCRLPGSADAGDAGGVEALLYEPAGRFRYPVERGIFLEGCRRQLSASGVSLVVCGAMEPVPEANTAPGAQAGEGGASDV